jgi:hypothetical protein
LPMGHNRLLNSALDDRSPRAAQGSIPAVSPRGASSLRPADGVPIGGLVYRRR